MQQYQLYQEFCNIVKGFADSLKIFRNALPERRKQKGKFSVSHLLNDYLPEENSESLHNAVDDVEILKKLLHKIIKSEAVIKENAKSITQIGEEKKANVTKALNKATLTQYKDNLSAAIINKMSKAGITQDIMRQAFEKNGKEGLRILLTENVNNKPRVTKNKKILESIYV